MKRFGFLVIIVALLTTACLQKPVPDEIFVMGDSITWQVQGYADNDPARPVGNYEWHTNLGWKYDNVIARADKRANDALLSPEIALEVIGMNDANPVWNGGWTTQDERNFNDLILHTFHTDTCMVVVLPWIGPGMDPAQAVEVSQLRDYVGPLAVSRPNTVILDAQTLPMEIIHPDGIHVLGSGEPGFEMIPTEEVARVRLAFYWDGINQCRNQ